MVNFPCCISGHTLKYIIRFLTQKNPTVMVSLSGDNLLQALACASQKYSSLHTIACVPAFASQPFLHYSAVSCVDDDEMATEEDRSHCSPANEPMRTISPRREAPPPRRFHRTFWRGLAVRLWNHDRARTEESADKRIIQIQVYKRLAMCRGQEITLLEVA